MIKNYNDFLNEEAAPRIPKSLTYWLNKSKKGKDVCIYTHDDMDGAISAIAIRNYLNEQGFNIVKYGIINYQESWDVINIDPSLINVAVDYADFHEGIDIYIDHHGEAFGPSNLEYASKAKTGSAYENIMDQIGKPVDKLTLDVIDMIDSAKYTQHGVKWIDLLDFDLQKIKESPNAKMLFAGAFNQMLKRSDYMTFIEVIHNAKDVSIFEIFMLFKKFFPKNNPEYSGRGVNKIKVGEKQMVSDARTRLTTMKQKTEGNARTKKIFKSQEEFKKAWWNPASRPPKLQLDGYQIIGNLAFFPSGIWANSIRARAILEDHIEKGIIPKEANIVYVLIQYGSTLQVFFYDKPEDTSLLPKEKDGTIIEQLGDYTDKLLLNFQKQMDYNVDKTTAGGHPNLGNVSNIWGLCHKNGFENIKFLDLFKNKMIRDLSGIKDWSVGMSWGDPDERTSSSREIEMNKRVKDIKKLRTIDKYGKIIPAQDDIE